MNPTTTSRATARLRLTVLAALPVLVLSAACGGAGDSAGGTGKSDEIASVPDTPSASRPADSGGSGTDGSAPSTAPAGKSAFYDAQVKYVQCMRVKGGYKDYPDPKLSGHLDWTKIEEISSRPGQNEAAKGGRNGVCAPELQRAMLAEPKRDQQKDYESMLAHAKCMRDNGVSRFTNPTMSGGNAQPGGDPNPASPTIDTNSPAYKQAREACATKLLDGLDGMQ
ncbi:hypothetical protein AQF52_7607 [Streptomyces venezuelae]|uniref:hypothetical protein n=1 Tax=Streptomyces gardneri TaxID=66892 RepID=UPI0006BDC919|nr:hypothetical protein [Streptomyces gardneri]ALO13193.1 hypothetical protein AQF52_7607 [Streptomyces venezuelae]QPK49855.1 hypothetical protein H4W23_38160 [Streptomyces gardneri]WRK41421.1 hypothetical protein U0M97_38390 [Streptomyces venezuelae]CUM36126.1 FIG01126514: hypothetical protein [Streptomyces venezuelae]